MRFIVSHSNAFYHGILIFRFFPTTFYELHLLQGFIGMNCEVRLWFIIVEVSMDLSENPVEMLSTLKMAARPPWGNNKIATRNSFTYPYLFPFSVTNDRLFKVILNWSRQVAARHHIKALLLGLYCVSPWQWVSRIFEIGNAFYRSACCTGHKPYITRVMHTSFVLLCLLVINP